jgi:hypothetical protein
MAQINPVLKSFGANDRDRVLPIKKIVPTGDAGWVKLSVASSLYLQLKI